MIKCQACDYEAVGPNDLSGHIMAAHGFGRQAAWVEAVRIAGLSSEEPNIYQEYGEERIRGDQLFGIAADLLKALEEIEAHHVEQNRIKGRDETHSTTLRIVRAAIAKARTAAGG